jgi:hypothetical protein
MWTAVCGTLALFIWLLLPPASTRLLATAISVTFIQVQVGPLDDEVPWEWN